jgi:RNA polymerase sigma factor (sigma-70 family)
MPDVAEPRKSPAGTRRRGRRIFPAVTTASREPQTDPVLQVLVENHRRFLAFLERRVGSRDAAEDILQDAFVRGLERGATLRDDGAVVAWFYRLLRNAVVDYHRRRGAEQRALAYAAGAADGAEPGPDETLRDEVCACVSALAKTLKPEYAAALQRVDLDGVSVAAFARETRITANNAAVRLHRAHDALRRQLVKSCGTCAEHACLDCRCGSPARPR